MSVSDRELLDRIEAVEAEVANLRDQLEREAADFDTRITDLESPAP